MGEATEILGQLAEEFTVRVRNGEMPDIEEYVRKRPDLTDRIRELFPTLLFLEGMTGQGPSEFGTDLSDTSVPGVEPGLNFGAYRIEREVGRGGMGIVWEAVHISLGKRVALKILPIKGSRDAHHLERFIREAKTAASLHHSNIVSVFDVGQEAGTPYYAMEFIDGQGLDRILKTFQPGISHEREAPIQAPYGSPAFFRWLSGIGIQAAEALEYAHRRGVIHRDIKPSNILLDNEGVIWITDFGLARRIEDPDITGSTIILGTPRYMSPEQARAAKEPIDHRTDIYSLGATMYELLTRGPAFDGKTPQEVMLKILDREPVMPRKLNSSIPRDLETIVLKALAKRREDRYQKAGELGDDLKRWLRTEPIQARRVGMIGRSVRWSRRNPVVASLMLAVVLILCLGISMITWQWQKAIAAEKESTRQREIAEARYNEIMRLSDGKRLSDLEEDAKELWPAYPKMLPEFNAWMQRAEDLITRLPIHRKSVEELHEALLKSEDMEIRWQYESLRDLVTGLEDLMDEEKGSLKGVEDRITFAATIEERSLLDHAERWIRALASIADKKECPAYDGLKIEKQIGLVPLGPDPESGLWEFAHLQTGEVPERGEDGKLVLSEEMGLVFVLIPGETFNMGASSEISPGSPNADPEAADWEGPVHEIKIKPFFISKYEMTQGQWLRFTGKMPFAYGPNNYNPAWNRDNAPHSLLHPVEQVSWKDCEEVLFRLKLRLPTESEWEYAARAGTTTIWWAGNAKESLQGAGNIADLFCKQNGPPAGLIYETALDDGFATHAPIGSFMPNAFGLHDVCGNVYEWCRDSFGEYSETPTDGSAHESSGSSYRVFRGGGFTDHAERCRSADRHRKDPSDLDHSLGLRPASSL